jgi:hypothetical protein
MPTLDFSNVAKVTESDGVAVVDAIVLKKQALPASPTEGQLAYDTADSKVKVWTGAAWVIVGTQTA